MTWGENLKVGIIGLGVVGNAIKNAFEEVHEVFVHDIAIGTTLEDVTKNCDVAYICVPTPTDNETGRCDLSIVKSVLESLPNGFSVVIKSTVEPGSTQIFHDEFAALRVACSPEYLREDYAQEDFKNQDILVVGTHHDDLAALVLKQHEMAGVLGGGQFFHVSPTEAEITKYAMNCFYSMKVVFGNQLQRLSGKLGANWSSVKEVITYQRKRGINDSHLEEIPGKMGFDGSCLPKDAVALTSLMAGLGIDSSLFKGVLEDNEYLSEMVNSDTQTS